MDLETEIARFKSWAAGQAQDYGEWEVDYQEWPRLRAAVDKALLKPALDDSEVELLLYALARDNECEFVRGIMEAARTNILQLARAAISHPDPDARWQIAEILSTLDEMEAILLLRRFVADTDEYVRRRAMLATRKQDREFAEETACRWVESAHEYSRLAALSVLHDLRSQHLGHALEKLRSDPSVYVRQRVAEIEGEV